MVVVLVVPCPLALRLWWSWHGMDMCGCRLLAGLVGWGAVVRWWWWALVQTVLLVSSRGLGTPGPPGTRSLDRNTHGDMDIHQPRGAQTEASSASPNQPRPSSPRGEVFMQRRYGNSLKSPPERPKGTPSTSITPQQLPAYPYPATPTSSTSLTHPAPSNAPPGSVVPACASPGTRTACTWNTTPGPPSLGRPPTANCAPWRTPSPPHHHPQ